MVLLLALTYLVNETMLVKVNTVLKQKMFFFCSGKLAQKEMFTRRTEC